MKKALMFLMAAGALNKANAADASTELIINGHFEETLCDQKYCVSNKADLVKGWLPDPDIEIGYGSHYNKYITTGKVLDLAPSTNSCVKQVVKNLTPGTYRLTYEYAAQTGRPGYDCEFEVKYNKDVLKHITPVDDRVQTDTIQFEVKCDTSSTDGQIRFCSVGGQNNWFGGIIKSVSFKKKEKSEVLALDSHAGKCLHRTFTLPAGKVQMNFDYEIISKQNVTSDVFVVLDGKPIYKIDACNAGKHVKLQGEITKGSHDVEICTAIDEHQVDHYQAKVHNFTIQEQPQCHPTWSKNLIFNGGFEQNTCEKGRTWCSWDKSNLQNSVSGWIANPAIEIGRSNIYNSAWSKLGQSWVSELDAEANTCIGQKIDVLKPGKYVVKFDWSAAVVREAASSGIDVKVNGKVVLSLHGTDHNLHREAFEFDLKEDATNHVVEFCGTGASDKFGATIDNIQLFYLSEC